MTEEQRKQKNKKDNGLLAKAAIIGVVAGLLGGGVSYAGLNAANVANNNSSAGSWSSTSSSTISNTV